MIPITGEIMRMPGLPKEPLAGKFDLKYCVALALHGHDVSAADFRAPWRLEPAVAATAEKVSVNNDPAMGFASAGLFVETADGNRDIRVPVAKGHPGNPMGWDDMERKFQGLAAPELGNRTGDLFALLRCFGDGAILPAVTGIVDGLRQT